MRIEIINTGTELLLGAVLNTHQQWLCRELTSHGYAVERQVAINDTAADIQGALREAMGRAELIITTGGLGPTSDDLTRTLVAELLGLALVENAEALRRIEMFFAGRKRPMPVSTRVQALIPEGAIAIQNEHGTAPGLAIPFPKGLIVMLPGPPRELRPMFRNQALPLIQQRFPRRDDFASVTLRTTGLGESNVEERIDGPLATLTNSGGLTIGYCARVGEVDVRLSGRTASVSAAEKIVEGLLTREIFGRGDDRLESAVIAMLRDRRRTLSVAESCTGGYIANRLTNVPGASDVFVGGAITYSNELKQSILGVCFETLQEFGAVSEQTARQMAEGARRQFKTDYALSVTGIAGPGGGSERKPVGTVFIGLADAERTVVVKHFNQYDRETFKFLTSQQALEMARRRLNETG